MTSYPGRITNVGKAIFFLLMKQTMKPDEIHLWLAEPEFPNRENDLPQDLLRVIDIDNVFLHWLPKNTFVHKRHEIFKQTTDNDCVFLMDDDVRYDVNLIQQVMATHEKFPDCIVCYNSYHEHRYDGRRILYGQEIDETEPAVNKVRWCGQSMIPSRLYPKEILDAAHQEVRDRTSPISDECWFQPWTVFYDIPIFHLNYGWGVDIDPTKSKWRGIVGFSHQKEANGYTKRDNWLYAVISSYPEVFEKYRKLFNYDSWTGYCVSLIPKIKARFKQMMGFEPNIDHPERFTEKLEWLKVYDNSFLKTYCADKVTAREYVRGKLGKDISIPVIGVYDKFDDIDFTKLPKDYVMKTNHGSHTNIIVRNGLLNQAVARKQINDWLSKDWSWWGYEMFYKLIPRKIIIEKFVSDGNAALTDYKFLCFNGKPMYCQVITGRGSDAMSLNYYDMDWTPCTGISRLDLPANYATLYKRPKTFDQMKEYASMLSNDFKFVRVDFYEIEGEVYFGELTFIPAASYIKYKNDATDFEFGRLLHL